ncbi:hypothetical protein [Chryseobacterium sp.]|uniref:hypothetical protein n=1 Tax=Chryseobacterium sp. TaxID=1871047 RepID=UPI003218E984
MDNKQYELAIDILTNYEAISPKTENLRLLFLSDCFYNIEEYHMAIETANKLLKRDHKNEYASRIKYFSYNELEDYENALNEIIGFLSNNKANLYETTLRELLIDIKRENISLINIVYKMKEIALKNNIIIQ